MAIVPYLYYEDAGKAMDFLRRAFGFKTVGRPMREASGKVLHAAMKYGKDVLMMGSPGGKFKSPKKLGQATQSLYINVTSVDRHFETAKKAGAKIIEEPTDTDYGHRRYGAEDPEGHQWYFAREIRKRKGVKA